MDPNVPQATFYQIFILMLLGILVVWATVWMVKILLGTLKDLFVRTVDVLNFEDDFNKFI